MVAALRLQRHTPAQLPHQASQRRAYGHQDRSGRFPLSLCMAEEMLVARGIGVSHEAVRQWALKPGQEFANRIRRRLPRAGDEWHLDEVATKIAGVRH